MEKLVLIDGNAILHRAFHALPPLTNKRGEPVNAVYGLVSMFLKIIQDLKPKYIAVAFDKPPTFRHIELPSYQAQRPKIDESLSSQFGKAREVIEAFKIPVYECAGFEADDVIATISAIVNKKLKKKEKNLKSREVEVIIVTGDRDLLQLVNKNTRVYMPIVGLTNAKLMQERDVVEKLGVKPEQIPDYKALVGDVSDNYPGVPGIGPKTASDLLRKFSSFENIYKNLDKIPTKVSEKLRKSKDFAQLYLKLATVVKDVPLKFSLENASVWDVDNHQVLKLFEKLGFKTLSQRVKKIGKALDEEKQLLLI